MNASALKQTIALAAITGMRSMAGPTVLAFRHGGTLKRVATLAAAGEMAADKTAMVGDRIDAVPLAGRAMMGALVGGTIAREQSGSLITGGLLGAVVAVAAAHLAYRLRKQLPVNTALGGVIEDAVVLGIGAYAARAYGSAQTASV